MKSLNYNENKPRPSLILKDMQFAFNEMLKVRENGAKKYDSDNWTLSKDTEYHDDFVAENLESILRHVLARLTGEFVDQESGCLHMAHIGIRAGFDIEYTKEKDMVDKSISTLN